MINHWPVQAKRLKAIKIGDCPHYRGDDMVLWLDVLWLDELGNEVA